MEANIILKKLDRIEDLPTLPAVAMEVNKMLLDYDTTIDKLSDTIEKDQAMVSKILKLVNSAFFGLRGFGRIRYYGLLEIFPCRGRNQ